MGHFSSVYRDCISKGLQREDLQGVHVCHRHAARRLRNRRRSEQARTTGTFKAQGGLGLLQPVARTIREPTPFMLYIYNTIAHHAGGELYAPAVVPPYKRQIFDGEEDEASETDAQRPVCK
jgi:hypothetical protein